MKDSFEARVLSEVSVCGMLGGSCVSFVGVAAAGGGVDGRGRGRGGVILTRRGEERS